MSRIWDEVMHLNVLHDKTHCSMDYIATALSLRSLRNSGFGNCQNNLNPGLMAKSLLKDSIIWLKSPSSVRFRA